MQLSEIFEDEVRKDSSVTGMTSGYLGCLEKKTLQGIFFHQIGQKRDRTSIERGLNFVKIDLHRRLQNYKGQENVEYFFEGAEPNQDFYELMEFWEVAKEYISVLTKDGKIRFSSLFSLVYEVDGNYHYLQYQKLIERMGTDFEERLEELCFRIEEIYNNKFIKILDFDMIEHCQISLCKFEKFINGLEYVFVRHCLANVMIGGGIAVVVAGSDGLTPKRLYGYKLKNNTWTVYSSKKLEPYREMLLAENASAARIGSLRGIC